MKTIEFIYQETAIHFLINPSDANVMVNATEMAKLFNKDVREFLKLDGTKKFINSKLQKLNNEGDSPHYNEEFLVKTNKKAGTLMLRPLALKFAAWLDTDFEVWVFDTLDNLVYGHYKKHWEAHAVQEEAKITMENLKQKLIKSGGIENALAYFEAERHFTDAKNTKSRAIRNQLRMFSE